MANKRQECTLLEKDTGSHGLEFTLIREVEDMGTIKSLRHGSLGNARLEVAQLKHLFSHN